MWKHKLLSVDRDFGAGECAACGPTLLTYRRDRDRFICPEAKRESYRNAKARGRERHRPRSGFPLAEVEARWEAQDRCCALCGQAVTLKLAQCDHDHETGDMRGVLCRACNVGLGMLGDDEAGLLRALSYLRSYH